MMNGYRKEGKTSDRRSGLADLRSINDVAQSHVAQPGYRVLPPRQPRHPESTVFSASFADEFNNKTHWNRDDRTLEKLSPPLAHPTSFKVSSNQREHVITECEIKLFGPSASTFV